jgi:hypothetical protein
MNTKKLQQKLEKKTQEIIENAPCLKCGKEIHYILMGGGNAGEKHYVAVETTKHCVIQQNGELHEGYDKHKCI